MMFNFVSVMVAWWVHQSVLNRRDAPCNVRLSCHEVSGAGGGEAIHRRWAGADVAAAQGVPWAR